MKKLTEKIRCARSTAQRICGGYIKFSLEPIKAIVFCTDEKIQIN
ncbi:hypothetical protein EUBSIR_00610 [[Eubacterium] siraeum DSM 15702]|uniref:Uncharacterized protein n=1 Tax=[Eubacterium] siraeum DSM 15702 TaxID=428128 RepID=B0MLB6_9FIRM|nr:hypothetical protein EUBSIR_00610 [[Eubacterium] siraeum DSM 15702]